ncbi:MAG: hypothetical protein FJZ98_10405 [Chloroflexi bacterium]|nr:hypothetical protein [Chloroflexota bacterium]
MPLASVSIDVDTLSSIYKGTGLVREGGYTFIELRTGLETISRFFEEFDIKTTLFMVGTDFIPKVNHAVIKSIASEGHELANHSMSHPQGFRWLTADQKIKEVAGMGEICKEITGIEPVGFRSPGWNMDDSGLPVLKRLGYQYDSSVFPTFMMPVMKAAHWASMFRQQRADRTTMGRWRYMFAPREPYRTSNRSLAEKGQDGLVEFPVTVTPFLRIPFFATLLLLLGSKPYKFFYERLRSAGQPIHFQMHLSDFVDYGLPELQDQIPSRNRGAYVPQALSTSIENKLAIFQGMIEMISRDYDFVTLKDWSMKVGN